MEARLTTSSAAHTICHFLWCEGFLLTKAGAGEAEGKAACFGHLHISTVE